MFEVIFFGPDTKNLIKDADFGYNNTTPNKVLRYNLFNLVNATLFIVFVRILIRYFIANKIQMELLGFLECITHKKRHLWDL